MIFKKCTNCFQDVGPDNVERIEINDMGLWWHHTACGGGGFLPIKLVRHLASEGPESEKSFYQNQLLKLKPSN